MSSRSSASSFGRKLAAFDEMRDQPAGGAVEDAVDQLADHRACAAAACVTAADHWWPRPARLRRTSPLSSITRSIVATVVVATSRSRRSASHSSLSDDGPAVPQDAQDFQFAVRGMCACRPGHGNSLRGWT